MEKSAEEAVRRHHQQCIDDGTISCGNLSLNELREILSARFVERNGSLVSRIADFIESTDDGDPNEAPSGSVLADMVLGRFGK